MIRPKTLKETEIRSTHSIGLVQIGRIYAVADWQVDGSGYYYFDEYELAEAEELFAEMSDYELKSNSLFDEEDQELRAIGGRAVCSPEVTKAMKKLRKKYQRKHMALHDKYVGLFQKLYEKES
jgi:hypothetical protein